MLFISMLKERQTINIDAEVYERLKSCCGLYGTKIKWVIEQSILDTIRKTMNTFITREEARELHDKATIDTMEELLKREDPLLQRWITDIFKCLKADAAIGNSYEEVTLDKNLPEKYTTTNTEYLNSLGFTVNIKTDEANRTVIRIDW